MVLNGFISEIMSYMGSPYSSSHQRDFEDDENYDDDDNDNNPSSSMAPDGILVDYRDDNSDEEDTEDASEPDSGTIPPSSINRREIAPQPVEIKEQMYQDKLSNLKTKIQQLHDGSHPDFNKKVKRLEYQYKERLRLNAIYREYRLEYIEREYVQEKKAAAKDFEDKKIDLRENLIADLEDKKRLIEADRYTMELIGDTAEVKPIMTRKLRRRPNEPVPVPEKRRKPPTAQITYLLDEKDIEHDLKVINKGKLIATAAAVAAASIRKPITISENTISTPQLQSPIHLGSPCDLPLIDTRIEDGKLLYEKRWFHRGQPVFVEGRDVPKFPANISAIGNEVIWVKKPDGCKVRIFVSNLARGKIALKRRAS